jgi:hypothetical protein
LSATSFSAMTAASIPCVGTPSPEPSIDSVAAAALRESAGVPPGTVSTAAMTCMKRTRPTTPRSRCSRWNQAGENQARALATSFHR